MNRNCCHLLFTVIIFYNPTLLFGQIQDQLNWKESSPISANEGFAGIYAGISNNTLLCMGGADSLSTVLWGKNAGKCYDHIFILSKGSNTWRTASEKLPRPIAFGVSFSYNNQVILVGGRDKQKHYSDVYTISYKDEKINIGSLTSLPFPLANMTGALVGNVLFIAGGNTSPDGLPTKTFLALDLLSNPVHQKWIELESWPGPARIQAVAASMHNNFFLFSGISKDTGTMGLNVLRDAYRFIPAYEERRFSAGGKWVSLSTMPMEVANGPSPAPTMGLNHILFPVEYQRKGNTDETIILPCRNAALMAYNVETETWLDFGKLPVKNTKISGPVVKWNQDWFIINGNSEPGKEAAGIFVLSKKLGFGWLNWVTLIVYLGLMLWIGFIYDKRGQSIDTFFTAGGRIPGWAAGLSIFGTQISAITFMSTPALVFATDWSLAIGSVMLLPTVPIVAKYYIPFFRKLSVTSAYEYLEHRFSKDVRFIGSFSFILFQLCRMGVVLYLPAIAIASVTGIDIYLLICIMGIICIIYTVMGGITAVVWTDVVQVIILMGGAILCFFIAAFNVEGGFASIISRGLEADKFALFHLGWKPDNPVLWVCIVGFFFLNIIPYTSDQTIVQR